jgi:hypothetical protein
MKNYGKELSEKTRSRLKKINTVRFSGLSCNYKDSVFLEYGVGYKPEDGGNTFIRNTNTLRGYIATYQKTIMLINRVFISLLFRCLCLMHNFSLWGFAVSHVEGVTIQKFQKELYNFESLY